MKMNRKRGAAIRYSMNRGVNAASSPPTPVLAINLPAQQRCTLGCAVLERAVGGGGVACGSITEIVGESGAGKTQLCLQLALCAVLTESLGGHSASSIYIHTEFPFPLRRLRSLSSIRAGPCAQSPLDHILVRGVHTAEELLAVLDRLGPLLSHPPSGRPVKVLIVDSVAALFRSDFDNNAADLKRRSTLFFRIASRLKEHAARFGFAVVVTNQVVDVLGSDEGSSSTALRVGNYQWLLSSGRRVCPALGLSWANCVTTRLFLSMNGECRAPLDDGGEGWEFARMRRTLQVVFAPHLPEASCHYVIVKEGVFGVEQ